MKNKLNVKIYYQASNSSYFREATSILVWSLNCWGFTVVLVWRIPRQYIMENLWQGSKVFSHISLKCQITFFHLPHCLPSSSGHATAPPPCYCPTSMLASNATAPPPCYPPCYCHTSINSITSPLLQQNPSFYLTQNFKHFTPSSLGWNPPFPHLTSKVPLHQPTQASALQSTLHTPTCCHHLLTPYSGVLQSIFPTAHSTWNTWSI